jgi:toxin ParE1/3/4
MSRPVVIRPRARSELADAAAWYENQREGLGQEFMAAVQECLDRFSAFAEAHPVIYEDVRRALVRRFPYNVLFQLRPEAIVVVAVIHSHRDPASWQSRL